LNKAQEEVDKANAARRTVWVSVRRRISLIGNLTYKSRAQARESLFEEISPHHILAPCFFPDCGIPRLQTIMGPQVILLMNIFVTGGAGYIGSVCVEELLNAGHSVTVFDNLSEGHRAAIDPRARFEQGDLMDQPGLNAALGRSGADAVMHFAANALVGESMQNPAKYFRNNVTGGLHLLEAMAHCGVRKIVFSSTCATFGTPERVPIDESMPQKPINPYGESKLMFEHMLRWFDEIHGIRHVALRTSMPREPADVLARITGSKRT
jgi:hypothetical protein